MRKLLYFLPILSLSMIGCSSNKISEGEILYEITYPNADISPLMYRLLPDELTITFLGTKTKTCISRGKMFSTEIISDEEDHSIEMRLMFSEKNIYTVLNADEIDQLIASQPVYKIKNLNKQDSLQGMFASSYQIDYKGDTLERSDAWFTEDLIHENAYWYTSYASIKGFPLIFDVERYNVMMHVNVKSLVQREVDETEFERDPKLEEVTFKEYEAYVQELFDALME